MTPVLAPRRVSTGSEYGQKPRTRFTEGDIPELKKMLLGTVTDKVMRGDIVRGLTHRQPLPPNWSVNVDWGHLPEGDKRLESLVAGYKQFLKERRR